MAETKLVVKPVSKLKLILAEDSIKEQFQNALKENAGAFMASIVEVFSSDTYLQECEPGAVVMECLKAATLNLPINKQLGFSYIIAYKKSPQFQMGYRGYIQLAMRTGQYRYLNADVVMEGVEVKQDLLTGNVEFTGTATSDKPQGYFAHMELLNGFRKTIYMPLAKVKAHAKRYSRSFGRDTSPWTTNFDEMAVKTTLRLLLGKYGVMSPQMMMALSEDSRDEEADLNVEIAEKEMATIIDMPPQAESLTTEEAAPTIEEECGF